MRGYRVDVNDRGNWRSLCARTGTVSFNSGATTVSLLDEGYVKAASATKKDAYPWQLFVHESLWGWDSYSLVAPRPGLTVSDPGDSDYNGTQTKTSTSTSVGSGAFTFDVTTQVHALPGSLPRLRFGNSYQFRARVVDLAGNSLPSRA